MSTSAETVAPATLPAVREGEPPLWSLALIFWGAFAIAVGGTRILNPGMFERWDPDSLMRLVQVRDLLAGQAWFDLAQHRLDPPAGVIMHWSRLIDAPLAGLVLVGNLFGGGEAFALAVWPLLLFLGLMAASMYAATALGGRAAAVPALVLALFSIGPMMLFLPNSIDHHNAQLALLVATFAVALRAGGDARFGLAAGAACALMLAVGLEMLSYVAVVGIALALRWAASGEASDGVAMFGIGFGLGPALLFLLAGSPLAPAACDSLSWSYALPAGAAGLGLTALTRLPERRGVLVRLAGLGALGIVSAAVFALLAPDCLGGPFAHLSAELKAVWLANVVEAEPIYVFAAREPAWVIATVGPPLVAMAVALLRLRRADGRSPAFWPLAAALIAVALAISFYQVRTLPFANAIAVPVLAAWVAEAVVGRAAFASRARRVAAIVLAVLFSTPLFHFSVGVAAVSALSLAADSRRPPPTLEDTLETATPGLTHMQRECLDENSAALFAQAPRGIVFAPVFYGSGVLAFSDHSVIAAPYHRAGEAILATIRAVIGRPEEARAVLRSRRADLLALCATSREAYVYTEAAPEGFLARALAGERFEWLEPVRAEADTNLRLWRVRP